jgi:hypothetical protein
MGSLRNAPSEQRVVQKGLHFHCPAGDFGFNQLPVMRSTSVMFAIRSLRWMTIAGGLLLVPMLANAQPGPGKPGKEQKPKPPIDEFRAIHKEIVEAYKAPGEVEKDVLDELRKQYKDPTPDREAKIFREIRRLYATTPELEEAIQYELRRAYENPSQLQEERVLAVMRRGGQLPLGAVPGQVQIDQAAKLFRKLDQNADGFLSPDEMSDALLAQYRRWDRNHDGAISLEEYGHYYHAYLNWVADGVASGEIPLKLSKASKDSETLPVPVPVEPPRPVPPKVDKQPAQLPGWFAQFDTDGDGQVGLYEWKAAGRSVADFLAMDRNGDGFLEADEVRLYLAEHYHGAGSGGSSHSLAGK